jgi:hypothetical protein
MFRKVTMAAVAAAAFAMMFCGNDSSTSQAFAKGGRGGHKGGHSVHNSHRRGSARGRRMVHRGRYFRGGLPYFYAYDGYVAPGIPMVGPFVTNYGYGLVYSDGYYGGGYARFRAHSRHARGGHSRSGHRGHGHR